jgi:putative flavoprotein involved in K+ transport
MRVDDCVVVGAGPAGLAASAALAERGVDHLVLERGRVGQSWRSQRWGSFRLNTPGWMNLLLGEQPGDGYPTGGEVVTMLDSLAAQAPVRERVAVTRLGPVGDGYLLHTSDGEIRARSVVVATGDQNVASIPALADRFPARIVQCTAAAYRCADALPDGAVLVVGSAQSGCQIAEDLLAAGRRVVLASSAVGRVPTPYRGRDSVEWLDEAGFFDHRPGDLPDPRVMADPQPIVAPGGRGLSLQALARAGVTLVGRLVDISGQRAGFDASVKANLAAGDAFAARTRAAIDELISRRGIHAPPAEPDDADAPVDLDPPTTIDLDTGDVSAVVWCTGFTGDFSWLDPGLVDAAGQPRHDGAAAPVPGLWYLGLRWLIRRSSSLLHGFPGDAATVADAVRAHLRT